MYINIKSAQSSILTFNMCEKIKPTVTYYTNMFDSHLKKIFLNCHFSWHNKLEIYGDQFGYGLSFY